MKILSIDVGIKNLAFCILEYLDDKYIIRQYRVIILRRLEDRGGTDRSATSICHLPLWEYYY